MKPSTLLIFFLVALLSASGSEQAQSAPIFKNSLCSLLETIENGEELPAVVSGIYIFGYEMEALYDPEQPECEINVQPSTWVEFSPSVADTTHLHQVAELDNRAYVTFKGKLVGPDGVLGPDDPSVPWMIVYAKRTGQRYGHLNSFRTKFVVDAVLDARPVPASVPRDILIGRPSDLTIESAEMPRYPPFARRAGLTGEVEVEVKVSAGKVTETNVKSGDRMLSAEAVKNVQSWKFSADVTTAFTTRFVYQLEKGPRRPSSNPKIESELPFLVKVTAPYFGW